MLLVGAPPLPEVEPVAAFVVGTSPPPDVDPAPTPVTCPVHAVSASAPNPIASLILIAFSAGDCRGAVPVSTARRRYRGGAQERRVPREMGAVQTAKSGSLPHASSTLGGGLGRRWWRTGRRGSGGKRRRRAGRRRWGSGSGGSEPAARLVLYGGWEGQSEAGDTWAFDGAAWVPLHPAHAPSTAEHGSNRAAALGRPREGSGHDDPRSQSLRAQAASVEAVSRRAPANTVVAFSVMLPSDRAARMGRALHALDGLSVGDAFGDASSSRPRSSSR